MVRKFQNIHPPTPEQYTVYTIFLSILMGNLQLKKKLKTDINIPFKGLNYSLRYSLNEFISQIYFQITYVYILKMNLTQFLNYKQKSYIKIEPQEVPLWHSGLRCCCSCDTGCNCGQGSIPALGISTCLECGQKKIESQVKTTKL